MSKFALENDNIPKIPQSARQNHKITDKEQVASLLCHLRGGARREHVPKVQRTPHQGESRAGSEAAVPSTPRTQMKGTSQETVSGSNLVPDVSLS